MNRRKPRKRRVLLPTLRPPRRAEVCDALQFQKQPSFSQFPSVRRDCGWSFMSVVDSVRGVDSMFNLHWNRKKCAGDTPASTAALALRLTAPIEEAVDGMPQA